VVLENATEVDKVAYLKLLKREFWAFPKNVGWNIDLSQEPPAGAADGRRPVVAVPSDAVSGNVIEAINTTLNMLDKHYIDRDLNRTGNSIVMISAGVGIFKVRLLHEGFPYVDTQACADTRTVRVVGAAGVLAHLQAAHDGHGHRPRLHLPLPGACVSRPPSTVITTLRYIVTPCHPLSPQPPLHFVPLFLFDCHEFGIGDFYVVPQWINVCYVDCHRDSSATIENTAAAASAAAEAEAGKTSAPSRPAAVRSTVHGLDTPSPPAAAAVAGAGGGAQCADPMTRGHRWTGLREFTGEVRS
jgi:hypothetical protein